MVVQGFTFVRNVGNFANYASKLGAIANVALSATAVSKIGDAAKLAGYLNSAGALDAAKLAADNLAIKTVNGQSVVYSLKEDTISDEVIRSLATQAVQRPVVEARDVSALDDFFTDAAASDVDNLTNEQQKA